MFHLIIRCCFFFLTLGKRNFRTVPIRLAQARSLCLAPLASKYFRSFFSTHPFASNASRSHFVWVVANLYSDVPISSQIVDGGFLSSDSTARMMMPLSHQTEGDRTANLLNIS